MSFERLEGQVFARRILESALQGGRSAHAYLFEGPPGCGKKTAAFGLAAALIDPPGGEGARRVLDNKHPDVHLFQPAGATFKVEQVRDLMRETSLRPFEGKKRVFILDRVEAFTAEAANTLLKPLEEPQESLSWVLVTTQASRVLPTILSRCQSVRFHPLDEATLRSVLTRELGVDAARAKDLAALSGGSVRLAAFLQGEEGQQLLDLADGFLEAAASGSAVQGLSWAHSLSSDRKEVAKLLPIVMVLLRELWAEASKLPADLRLLSAPPKHGRSLRPEAIQALMGALAKAQEALARNANVGLALDNLALAGTP
jgi:DNA polymerase-3 subunit delta'